MTDNDLPSLFQVPDGGATTAQKRLYHLTALLLIFGTAAAVFGAIEIESSGVDWAALGSLVTLAGGLAISAFLERKNPNGTWYQRRALAESAKSLAWMYSVGGSDFRVDDQDADGRYEDQMKALKADFASALKGLAEVADEFTTRAMLAVRAGSPAERRDNYRDDRIEDQIGYYGRRAEEHRTSRNMWTAIQIGALVAAVALALLRFLDVIHDDFVGIATTVSASALAWLRAHDYAGLAEAYDRTHHELTLIRDDIGQPKDEAQWAEYVANAELAMSREHTSWIARRRRIPGP
jgi:hypothetical protein